MMTEDRLIELGFEAGVLNYQEIGTDRHYYVTDAADTKDLMDFAKLIAKECMDRVSKWGTFVVENDIVHNSNIADDINEDLRKHFGIKE
jgi:isopropylmalate/homocitrate/citramalate synthase